MTAASTGAGALVHIERARSTGRLRELGWDDLLGDQDLYVSCDWLRVVELASTRSPLYLVAVGDGGRLLGGVCACVFDARSAVLAQVRADRLVPALLPEGRMSERDAASLLPNLYCGSRQPGHCRLPVAAGAPAATRPALLHALESEAGAAGARSLLFAYVDDADVELRSALAACGYATMRSESSGVVELRWSDFDGYLGSFRTHRRHVVRRERAVLRSAGVCVRVGQVRPETIPRLAQLKTNQSAKHGVPGSVEQYMLSFRALLKQLNDRLIVMEATLDGDIVGFTLWARWRDALASVQSGFDYERQGRLPLFLALVFYEPIEWAAANGVRWIELGGGGMAGKTAHGCTEVTRSAYLKRLDRPRT